MPYSKPSEVPEYVPKDKRAQWMEVFNSAYSAAIKDGKTKEEAEGKAFAEANGVAGPSSKVIKIEAKLSQVDVSYTPTASDLHTTCERCEHFIQPSGCILVAGTIASTGWCKKFEPVKGKSMKTCPDCKKTEINSELSCCESCFQKRKRTPFVKVDAVRREVWGVVTAQLPDKDDEVCDYDKTKPYYMKWTNEFKKATDGESLGNLREMHQLSAVGKAIGIEFHDDDKEIYMGFKVVDDAAWKKVVERVYTGFSHGGRKVGEMVEDPTFKGCMRYVADPSEVSLVDNPCLAEARYALIRADGSVEMVKIAGSEPAITVPVSRFEKLITDVAALKASASAKVKTKRVCGEDLPATAFAYVGDPEKPETWSLPIEFSVAAKTKGYLRSHLARFDYNTTIPGESKIKVHERIVAACKKNGIDVAKEAKNIASIHELLRKTARRSVNKLSRKMTDIGHSLTFLDDELGKLKLKKSLYDAGRLAAFIQELGYMLYNLVWEEESEKDDSELPAMLEDNINDLLDSLVALVAEESQELREDMATHVHPA